MARMSLIEILGHIPFEQFCHKKVKNKNSRFQKLILIRFDSICRMMRLDEIDPTQVEGAEAATNLETAGYPQLLPLLRCVDQATCVRRMMDWNGGVGHYLNMLGIMWGPFPVTVNPLGHRYGRFSSLDSLNQFRHQVLTSEMDVFFCWDSMCRISATQLHHTQSFVVGIFCVNLENSLIQFPIHSMRRRCWELMLGIVSTLVCREQRFRWGYGTTNQYARIIRQLIWQANDFALFYVPVGIRNMLRDQVVCPHVICNAARVAQYDAYLELVAI